MQDEWFEYQAWVRKVFERNGRVMVPEDVLGPKDELQKAIDEAWYDAINAHADSKAGEDDLDAGGDVDSDAEEVTPINCLRASFLVAINRLGPHISGRAAPDATQKFLSYDSTPLSNRIQFIYKHTYDNCISRSIGLGTTMDLYSYTPTGGEPSTKHGRRSFLTSSFVPDLLGVFHFHAGCKHYKDAFLRRVPGPLHALLPSTTGTHHREAAHCFVVPAAGDRASSYGEMLASRDGFVLLVDAMP